ncbi:hypothetical protein ANCCEY_10704 [Ancylostoma ceylanicum]|uniref:Uncharacterized protein n=1 Tax=Ancylostoma ceylanicum TaxID=53326 RepID=A0A0D6LGA5_9BILA|nr:hypothetical protein ANCCEY_10704 [Ancylostoma ceylanicum]
MLYPKKTEKDQKSQIAGAPEMVHLVPSMEQRLVIPRKGQMVICSGRLLRVRAARKRMCQSFNGYKSWFWVPIVGPFIGAIIGAWLYQLTIGFHTPQDVEEKYVVLTGNQELKPLTGKDGEEA